VGKLVYSMQVSADGFINGPRTRFDWANPDDEVLTAIYERSRDVGAYVYGRRFYETTMNWAHLRTVPGLKELDYAYSDLWNATPKFVLSTTLAEPPTTNTTILREFDPVAIRALADASEKHVTLEGASVGEQALRAGIVDGVSVYVVPIATGEGTPFWPRDLPLQLRLVDERRFASGIVNLRYAPVY
jgi:dihydrofolate reductase